MTESKSNSKYQNTFIDRGFGVVNPARSTKIKYIGTYIAALCSPWNVGISPIATNTPSADRAATFKDIELKSTMNKMPSTIVVRLLYLLVDEVEQRRRSQKQKADAAEEQPSHIQVPVVLHAIHRPSERRAADAVSGGEKEEDESNVRRTHRKLKPRLKDAFEAEMVPTFRRCGSRVESGKLQVMEMTMMIKQQIRIEGSWTIFWNDPPFPLSGRSKTSTT